MKPAVIALLLLAVLGLIYVYLDGAPMATVNRDEVVSAEEAPDPGALESRQGLVEDLEPAAAAKERAPVGAPVAAEEEERAVESVTMHGEVVVVDEFGTERWDLDGDGTALLWAAGGVSRTELGIAKGVFEVDVIGAREVSIVRLELGGRTALPEDPRRKHSVGEGPIVVRARWPRILRLNVLSAETGEHLSGVTILRCTDGPRAWWQHPGEVLSEETVLDGGVSPIELRPTGEETRPADVVHFVHGPGYAWKSIHLDLLAGGEREVRLEEGGDLGIRIVGRRPPGETFLRLRRPDQVDPWPFLELSAKSETAFELDGLPAGAYRARIERGDDDRPEVLGAVDVEVVAGRREHYELLLEPPPDRTPAKLAGTITVPAEWKLDSFSLTAKRDGGAPDVADSRFRIHDEKMEKLGDRTDTWAFDFGEIPTGPYALEVANRGGPARVEYSWRLTLEAGGLWDVHLAMPPPATVVVHVVDATTGETIELDWFYWSPLTPEGNRTGALVRVEPDEGMARYEFLATTGEIELGSFGGGAYSFQERMKVRPGRNERTLQLERDCLILVLLFDGETPVPFPVGSTMQWTPDLRPLDGEGKLTHARFRDPGLQLSVNQPGRYEIELPEIPGFETTPPMTFTARRDMNVEFSVQLERKR